MVNLLDLNCQPTYNPQGEYYASGGFGNPIAYAQHTGNKWKTYYSYYTQLGFDITPIKNLTITGDMSLNYDITDEKYYRKKTPDLPLGWFSKLRCHRLLGRRKN